MNFSAIALEVYSIIKSFDYILDLYDKDSNKTYEPEKARKFFASKTNHKKVENLLVEIDDLNELSIIRLHTGPSSSATSISGLWDSLKVCATKYNMLSGLETHNKEIQPKDFAGGPINEGKRMTDLNENMYGTSRSSYQRIGEARMIVRHNKRIDDSAPGARTKNVDQIFVENAAGERYLMPTQDVAAGRAMTQHVNQGGTWADPVADQINNMSGFFSDLGASISYLGSPTLMEKCEDLRDNCKAKRKSIRESFNRIYKESTYKSEVIRLESISPPALLEDASANALREKLCVGKKQVPENVFNACARVLAESDCVVDEEIITEKQEEETISVLGREVSKDSWDKFKRGELDVTRRPDLSSLPIFKDLTSQVMFKLESIAKVVKDDSLANLLSSVYDDFVHDRLKSGSDRRRLSIVLGIEACKAAKVPIQTENYLGPRGVTAILEMEEWFKSFSPNSVLLEKSQEECDADQKKIKELEDKLEDCEDSMADCVESAGELTKEDIILPKDEALDLAKEVVADDEEDEELDRLRSLSGIVKESIIGDYEISFKMGSWRVTEKATGRVISLGFKTKQEAEDSAKLANSLK